MMLTMVAIEKLRAAGYHVQPADGVPGLWNVDGLARDVSSGQLAQIATAHGALIWPPLATGIYRNPSS